MSAILFTASCGASETNTSGVAQIRESDKTAAQAEAKSNNSVEENTTETVTANDDNAPAEEPNKTDEEIATDFTECMRDEGFELPDP